LHNKYLVAVDCSAVAWIRTVHEAGYVTSPCGYFRISREKSDGNDWNWLQSKLLCSFILQRPSI